MGEVKADPRDLHKRAELKASCSNEEILACERQFHTNHGWRELCEIVVV